MSLSYCPPEMAPHIEQLFSGEYDLPYSHPCPVILDIGANIGGFTVWASERWPNSFIHCFEPAMSNFAHLRLNTDSMPNVALSRSAVTGCDFSLLLKGKNNCGEASFYLLGEQSEESEIVGTISPLSLPQADILKIDTEGCEPEILSALHGAGREYGAILFEYHRETDAQTLELMLSRDYDLISKKSTCIDRGIMKFRNKKYQANRATKRPPTKEK